MWPQLYNNYINNVYNSFRTWNILIKVKSEQGLEIIFIWKIHFVSFISYRPNLLAFNQLNFYWKIQLMMIWISIVPNIKYLDLKWDHNEQNFTKRNLLCKFRIIQTNLNIAVNGNSLSYARTIILKLCYCTLRITKYSLIGEFGLQVFNLDKDC